MIKVNWPGERSTSMLVLRGSADLQVFQSYHVGYVYYWRRQAGVLARPEATLPFGS
jgi:hypothetical protein